MRHVLGKTFKVLKTVLVLVGLVAITLAIAVWLIGRWYIGKPITTSSAFNNKWHVMAKVEPTPATVPTVMTVYRLESGNETAREEPICRVVNNGMKSRIRFIREDIAAISMMGRVVEGSPHFVVNLVDMGSDPFEYWLNYEPEADSILAIDTTNGFVVSTWRVSEPGVVVLKTENRVRKHVEEVYFLNVDSIGVSCESGDTLRAIAYWQDGSTTPNIRLHLSVWPNYGLRILADSAGGFPGQ